MAGTASTSELPHTLPNLHIGCCDRSLLSDISKRHPTQAPNEHGLRVSLLDALLRPRIADHRFCLAVSGTNIALDLDIARHNAERHQGCSNIPESHRQNTVCNLPSRPHGFFDVDDLASGNAA